MDLVELVRSVGAILIHLSLVGAALDARTPSNSTEKRVLLIMAAGMLPETLESIVSEARAKGSLPHFRSLFDNGLYDDSIRRIDPPASRDSSIVVAISGCSCSKGLNNICEPIATQNSPETCLCGYLPQPQTIMFCRMISMWQKKTCDSRLCKNNGMCNGNSDRIGTIPCYCWEDNRGVCISHPNRGLLTLRDVHFENLKSPFASNLNSYAEPAEPKPEERREVVFQLTLSACVCEDGADEECLENKRETPSNPDNRCLCAFDDVHEDAWPCFQTEMWQKGRCDTCDDQGYCTSNGPKTPGVDCYCNKLGLCVAYNGLPFLKLWEYYNRTNTRNQPTSNLRLSHSSVNSNTSDHRDVQVVFREVMALSACICEGGAEEECQENKMEIPSNPDTRCLCAFSNITGDAWPCFQTDVWRKARCDTCTDQGFCLPNGPKTPEVDCYCKDFCVAYDGRPFLKLWEYYNRTNTGSSSNLRLSHNSKNSNTYDYREVQFRKKRSPRTEKKKTFNLELAEDGIPEATTVLTGVSRKEHNISSYRDVAKNFFNLRVPTIFNYIAKVLTGDRYMTAAANEKDLDKLIKLSLKGPRPLHAMTWNSERMADWVAHDLEVIKETKRLLMNNPRFHFLYLGTLPRVGYRYGFGSNISAYYEAAQATALQIDQIVAEIAAQRKKRKDIQWLIVVTSDFVGSINRKAGDWFPVRNRTFLILQDPRHSNYSGGLKRESHRGLDTIVPTVLDYYLKDSPSRFPLIHRAMSEEKPNGISELVAGCTKLIPFSMLYVILLSCVSTILVR